jgi:hypothetical protein
MIGKAIVWGIAGTVAYTGMATTSNEPQSVEYTEKYAEHAAKTKLGETIGLYLFDKQEELTIDFYPCADAGAAAIATAEAAIVLPAPGAKVTIAAMKGSVINDTTWIYKGGGKISEGNDHEVKMTLPLIQYSTDISTATS